MGGPNISQQTIQPEWFDPLGPDKAGKHDPTGGPEYRSSVFSTMQGQDAPSDSYRNKLLGWLGTLGDSSKAGNITGNWTDIRTLGNDMVAGKYLNGGPYLDEAVGKMRAASAGEAAGADANARSTAARAGIAFSTPAQEAQQSVTAGARAAADQAEGTMRQAVYSDERKQQPTGASLVREGANAPVDYLAQAQNAIYSPLAKRAQIIQGLSGGGTYMTPEVVSTQKPGALDYATQIISSL